MRMPTFKVPSTYRVIQLAMLVILGTAFVTSFKSGAEGAGRLGYDPSFTISLPMVCDVIAGAATAIHGRVRKDKDMRRLAAWFVLIPMLLSWGSNSVDHAYRAAAAADGWVPLARVAWYGGVILAAGICPVAVAGLLHLSTKYQEFEQRQIKVPKPVAAKPTAPKTPLGSRPAPVGGDELAARKREQERLKKQRQRAAARERKATSHG